jgi:Phage tail baseplate hub (GPD)
VPSSFQVWMQKQPATQDFYDRLLSIEVEESADMPGAIQIRLPVARTKDGDLTSVNDAGLQPLSPIAVTVAPEGGDSSVIFDGYVLGHKLHVESGIRQSMLEVYGQDASWMMSLEEKTKEWADTTEGNVANSIFDEYGFTAGSKNLDDDSGTYTDDAHTLMQRGTDFDFLKTLARRSGRLFRVIGGPAPGSPVGVFAKPDTDGDAAATLKPNDPDAPNVSKLDFEWDVMRPTAVSAEQALFSDSSGTPASGDSSDSGLSALGDRDLATFAGKTMTVRLTVPADDAGQLSRRAAALLRDADWFVRCSGECNLSAVHVVFRPGSAVNVEGVGSVHSGKYLVWSVRHVIDQHAHKMNFTLVRNAVGAAPSNGAASLLGGLL